MSPLRHRLVHSLVTVHFLGALERYCLRLDEGARVWTV